MHYISILYIYWLMLRSRGFCHMTLCSLMDMYQRFGGFYAYIFMLEKRHVEGNNRC
jgi:hypothetical protein